MVNIISRHTKVNQTYTSREVHENLGEMKGEVIRDGRRGRLKGKGRRE